MEYRKNGVICLAKIAAPMFALLCSFACSPQIIGNKVSKLRGAWAPKNVSLTSSLEPVEYIDTTLTTASTVANSGSSPSASLIAFTGLGSTGVGAGSTPAFSLIVPTDPTSLPSNTAATAAASTPIYDSISVTVRLNATFHPSSIPACETEAPFTNLAACTVNQGINFSSSALPISGNLKLRAYASNGDAFDSSITNNSVRVRKFVLEKVIDQMGGGVSDGISLADNSHLALYSSAVVGVKKEALEWNGAFYFSAYNSLGRKKLFKHSGTSVTQVSNLTSNQNTDDNPTWLTVYNGKLHFVSNNSLFSYDGTTFLQLATSVRNNLLVYNGSLYFTAINGSGGTKLFQYNGASITQVTNTISAQASHDFNASSSDSSFAISNGKLYFIALNSSGNRKLYEWDGSTLTQISNTRGVATSDDFSQTWTDVMFEVYQNKLYFVALNSSANLKWYTYDGTTLSQPFQLNASNVDDIASPWTKRLVWNNKLYFVGWCCGGMGQSVVFSWDDTSVTRASKTSGNWAFMNGAFPYGSYLYYTSQDVAVHQDLFRMSTTGTQEAFTGFYAAGDDVQYQQGGMFEYRGDFYFVSKNSAGFGKLYRYDDTRLTQVADLQGASNDFLPDTSCSGTSYQLGNQFIVTSLGVFMRIFESGGAGCIDKLYRLKEVY